MTYVKLGLLVLLCSKGIILYSCECCGVLQLALQCRLFCSTGIIAKQVCFSLSVWRRGITAAVCPSRL